MRLFFTILLGVTVSACAALPRQPVPESLYTDAIIPGIPQARYWADEPPADLEALHGDLARQRAASGLGKDVVLLALSGGADDGAFGAGLLTAWTKLGGRPEFTVVTGVSTGALSAPFAFLGPDYDDRLKELYGGFPANRIFEPRSWLNILPRASVADVGPLEELIAKFADEDMLAAIAREHRRGRRLLIQTTNLDAERPVIWDLGAIAASGAPNAIEIFRKALLASASIPVAFPPVLFDVEAGGEHYDEMHVDGGVVSAATVLSDWQVDLNRIQGGSKASKSAGYSVYLVRNGKISPEFQKVERTLVSIAGRSLGTLLKVQSGGALLSTYATAELRGAAYHATWIGDDFKHPRPAAFDVDYMRALYQYGFDLMMSGNAWFDRPPVLMSAEERQTARAPLTNSRKLDAAQ